MLGENGTGKTTYIRMMAGKLEPDSGTGNERTTIASPHLSVEKIAELFIFELLSLHHTFLF